MKRMAFRVGLAAWLSFFALACRDQAAPSSKALEPNARPDIQADVAAIKAMEDEFVRLYNACEFDKLMAFFYTDDIVLMAPDDPPIHGKDALLRSYLKDDALNIEHVETSVVEDVRVSGDLAVARGRDTGTTTARKGGQPVPYDLKWVMAFERQPDRTWICCYEIWCENPLAQQKSTSVEQELIKLEHEWTDAWVKSDVAFNDRIMSDDFTWTSPSGEVWTKAQDIKEIKSGDSVIASWVLTDLKVRVYGDAAVVTGRSAVKETYKGKELSDQVRWTHAWVKFAGRWQCVAAHSSRIPQK